MMARMHILRQLAALCLALMLGGTGLWAITLPIKTIHGTEVYYYKVGKGESLYGVSRKLEVPVERIVEANPRAADGIRKDDILIFPCDAFPEISSDKNSQQKGSGVLPTINPDADGTLQADFTTRPSGEELTEEAPTRQSSVVGFILPFGLNNGSEEPSRRNNMALEFYKGVLLAADTLRNEGQNTPITIVARDCDGMSAADLRLMVRNDSLLSRADVIVAPDVDSLVSVLPTATSAYVLNVLNMRDSSYMYFPRMVQTNIPQRPMYADAVEAILNDFADYQPVILRNTEGRNDREAFTTYLSECLEGKGIKPLTIEYKGNLLQSQLDALATSAGAKYVLIPSGASVTEFNRFAYVLRNHNERFTDTGEEGSGGIALFGYPDWTAFRGEARDMLHTLGATIYSRFLDDPESYNSECLNNAFIHWYGTPLKESVPMYGTLGFDVASFIITNIRENEGSFDPARANQYTGIQSSFDLIRAERGYVNNALYIITYLPDGTVSARVR